MVMTTKEIITIYEGFLTEASTKEYEVFLEMKWYSKEEIETKIDKTYSLTIRQDNTDKFSDDLLKRFHIIH